MLTPFEVIMWALAILAVVIVLAVVFLILGALIIAVRRPKTKDTTHVMGRRDE